MNESITAWSTLALALLTLFLFVGAFIQIRKLIISQKLSTLSNYLIRYNNIISKIPFEYFSKEFSSSRLSEKDKSKLIQVMFDYWNLISEEFIFYKRGWIDDKIWNGWQKKLRTHLSNHSFFLESWKVISNDINYTNDLKDFILNYNTKNNKSN